METDGQRFYQRPFHGADMIRELKAQGRLVCHIFLEYPVHRRRCEKYHIRAEIVAPGPAEFTMSAGLSRFQGHPVAGLQMRYIPAHLDHGSPRLMSQHKRWLDHIISDLPGLIVVQIAAADTNILQFNQNLVILRRRNLPLLKSHLPDPQHHGCFHGSLHMIVPPLYCFI